MATVDVIQTLKTDAIAHMVNAGLPYQQAVNAFRKAYLLQALEVTNGNRCKAARLVQAHRNTLSRELAGVATPRRKKPSGTVALAARRYRETG